VFLIGGIVPFLCRLVAGSLVQGQKQRFIFYSVEYLFEAFSGKVQLLDTAVQRLLFQDGIAVLSDGTRDAGDDNDENDGVHKGEF